MAARGPDAPTPVQLTGATTTPDIVEMPSRIVLSLSGEGSPDSAGFGASVGALYGIAYGLKFGRKKAGGADFKVGALVGIWWAEGANLTTDEVPPRDAWRWSVQLDMPADVTRGEVDRIIEAAVSKKGGKLEASPFATQAALMTQEPRRFARILHVGPYADEPRSFAAIQAMLDSEGLAREPWHIEVYVSDPGRTPPEKLKTVLLAPLAG